MRGAPVVGLAIAGPLAVVAAWLAVRRGLLSVWSAMGITVGALGALSVATGRIRWGGTLGPWTAVGVGILAGLALYAATAAFMAVARRWPPLARQAEALYDQRRGMPVTAALALAVLLVAPGEELLWRGVVQGLLSDGVGPLAGAALAWGIYVAANAASASIPIVVGAGVGGAAWSALALWSGGVLAGILCHAVWTGLMIVLPPGGVAPR